MVPEAVLHTVCAICGVLPLIIFHEDGDLYQLLLQIVLYPMFCYIVSIICILTLKRHSSIVFSIIIIFTLFYRWVIIYLNKDYIYKDIIYKMLSTFILCYVYFILNLTTYFWCLYSFKVEYTSSAHFFLLPDSFVIM